MSQPISKIPEVELRELQGRVRGWRRKVLATPPAEAGGIKFCRSIADFVDEVMRQIYEIARRHAIEVASSHYVQGETEVAIVATGGYGRKELCPYSDIDIAFVPSEEENPYVDALIKKAFQLVVAIFMDTTDLQVGYGYRPLSDIPHLDHITRTSLLDSRLVAGCASLVQQLRQTLWEHLDLISFLQEKASEREAAKRHLHRSVYVVEPNLKEGPGGLRHLQAVLWMLMAVNRVSGSPAFDELVKTAHIPPDRAKRLEEALDFLLRVRNWLHLTSQRKTDVLLREYHHRIALELGFGQDRRSSEGIAIVKVKAKATASQPQRDYEQRAVLEFFDELYRAMEFVHRFAEEVKKRLLNSRLSLGSNLIAYNQQIHALSPDVFDEEPVLLLKVFELAQRYGFDLSYDLFQLVSQKAHLINDDVRCCMEAAQSFLSALTGSSPHRTLQLMVDTGVLQSYLPEIASSLHYIPANAAHDYTVGEHGIVVVSNLAQSREEAPRLHSLMADAWGEIKDEEVLFLAGLVHDIAKPISEPDHCELGAAVAEGIAQRMGLEAERIHLLTQLVRLHLPLLKTSRLRDISAPETIRYMAEQVKDPVTLKMLYLLSYADAKAVSPHLFSDVDSRLLDELYAKVNDYLRSEQALEEQAARQVDRVARELRIAGVSKEEVRQFVESLPPGYLLNTPMGTIAAHIQLVRKLRETGAPLVDVYNDPRANFTELTVCTYDDPQPGMLNKIAGTLFACDVDIRTAQVFTFENEPRIVLDTLWVLSDGGQLSEAKARRVTDSLQHVLSARTTVAQLLERAKKTVRLPVHVRFVEVRNDLSETHTVIHIKADDRKGLLYQLTAAVAQIGLDIATAKIFTWGNIAEDAFYVSRSGGGKVPDEELKRLEERLREVLGG